MNKALSGILVVSLEQAVAAPYVSSRLADAGARVIKIERKEGDFARGYDSVVNGESAYFVWLNRGKESLVLDIKDPDDKALLTTMLEQADVFIQNLAPAAAARAGFDSERLRQRNARLITCDISGYGETGHYAHRKAYDLLVQAESGLASITGSAAEPGRVGVSVCDIAAGMHAWAGILQALFEREHSGRGQGIKVSLFDGMADWMSVPLLHYRYGGEAPPRVGLRHPTIAPYGVFLCGDGEQVLLSVQNEREWQRLCEQVLRMPELISDPQYCSNEVRVRNRTKLDGIVATWFRKLSLNEVTECLESAEMAFGILNDVAALAKHPQLRTQTVKTPAGNAELVASPIRTTKDSEWNEVPTVGQHTAAIRREFSSG